MDIPREPPKKLKRYRFWLLGAGALVVGTVGIGRLGPAAPSVQSSTVFRGTVERGTMLRQVRGPGTLVPEQIRWVPAIVAGRIERKFILPGTRVDSGTVLLEMSNPEVQLELLSAEQQLAAAQAQLVTLRTTIETQDLDQKASVAAMRALYLEAARFAAAADTLEPLNLISSFEAQTARDRVVDFKTRLDLAEERLVVLRSRVDEQIAVQELQVRRLGSIVRFQQDRIASMHVVAGTHGVLQDMDLEEGQWVTPGQVLARVVQPERLKAVLRIPQVQARDVAIGQLVMVDTRTDTIPGRVIRIDPSVQNGAVNIDVALEGELPLGARPDLNVDGVVEIERLVDVLYMGRPAFGQSHSTVGLFKMVEGNFAERVSVRLGRASVNTIEIIEGLLEGDVVIISDMSDWDTYDRVRIK